MTLTSFFMLCSRRFGWCLSLHQLKNNVSTRDSNSNTPSAHLENICVQFPEKRSARLICACQRLVDLWDGDVVISRLRIPYRKPGFHEKSLMIISLIFGSLGIHAGTMFNIVNRLNLVGFNRKKVSWSGYPFPRFFLFHFSPF